MFGFGKKKTISELPVPPDMLEKIKLCAADATRLIGPAAASRDPRVIMAAINEYACNWQKGVQPPDTDLEDSRYTLGSLWGEVMVVCFKWEWASVTFHEHGDSVAVGVFPPNRSLAVYPFHFLLGCLRDPGVPVTILLAFNMLTAKKIPPQAAQSYENLMDGVRHIVPPAR